MTEDIDDSSDSKTTYGISFDNISNQRSLLCGYNTLGYTHNRNGGRAIQNVVMAGIYYRPSIGLSCW